MRVSRKHKGAVSEECPHCDGVRQTSPHVLLECPIGEEMRQAVSSVYESYACNSQGLSFHAMLNHVLSNNSPMSKAQDKVLRDAVLSELCQHSCLVKQQLNEENYVRINASVGALDYCQV